MRFLVSSSSAFVFALVGVLIAMLVSYWLGLARFQLWLGICIAAGTALGVGAKTQWQLSRGAGAALVGFLVGVGYVADTWLSARA
jgi:hypothetical protein